MENLFWYQEYPEIHQFEVDALQNRLSSFFKFQQQIPPELENGQLSYLGELNYGDNKTHLIKVLFPQNYPFFPPEIYPVEIIKNGGNEVAVTKRVSKTNQYNDNKICLFKDEDDWEPFKDDITSTLKQAQHWFKSGTSEEGFKNEEVVIESVPFAPHIGQVLFNLPNEIPDFSTGMITLKRFKENYYSLIQLQTDNNILPSIPDNTSLTPSDSPFVFNRCFSVPYNTGDIIPKLCNPQFFTQFMLNQGITIDDLLPPKNSENNSTVIAFVCGVEKELHFFQLTRFVYGHEVKPQLGYLLPKRLNKELFIRADELFDLDKLSKKKVLIIGLGAIGSEVATELSASGVGVYTLIDGETFEVGNSIRHAADLLKIGEQKVQIVKDLIQGKNPNANVTVIPANISRINKVGLQNLIKNADLILDLTANRLVEELIHKYAFKDERKSIISASVSLGGFSGIVSTFIPDETACLQCQKKAGLLSLPNPSLEIHKLKETVPDYGACSKPAMPASGIDTKEVALQTARIAVQLLLKGEKNFYPKLQGHNYYWHGSAGSKGKNGRAIKNAHQWSFQEAPLTQNCPTCNFSE